MAAPTLRTWGRGSHINERNNTKWYAMVQKNKRIVIGTTVIYPQAYTLWKRELRSKQFRDNLLNNELYLTHYHLFCSGFQCLQ
ncbi:MAG: hypothetical protein RIR11_88 [Bacteroidota bacterium]|jgi:hypothetical protein